MSERLKKAIRRQTVEAPNDMPNGPTEKAFYELGEALKPRGNMAIHWDKFANVRRLFGGLGQAIIDDVHELREAADEFFEEDFTKP